MKMRLLPILLAFAAGCARAAESPSDFALALPIDGVGNDAFYRIGVPQQVYESAAFADLRDIRVFNGGGEVVPHSFPPRAPVARQPAPIALPFFPLRGPRGANADDLDLALESSGSKVSLRVRMREPSAKPTEILGYLVDCSARKEMLSGLRLEWAEMPAGYLGALRVEASGDLKQWTALVERAPVMSLAHNGHRLEQKTVGFHPQRAKYLRLTWKPDEEILPLEGVFGLPVEEFDAPARAWKEVDATPNPRRPGDYFMDLGGVFPVDRLAVRLPQENAVASLQVLARDKSTDEWRPVARSVAYRLRQGADEVVSPEMAVAPTARRYWLLRVDQKGGGVGEGAIQVKAGWMAREIVFAARGGGPFLLAFGNGRARSNVLAIETLVPGWGSASAPRIATAATGSVRTLAGKAAARQRIDTKKAGLWTALFAGVALLGFMAWRLSKQLQSRKG